MSSVAAHAFFPLPPDDVLFGVSLAMHSLRKPLEQATSTREPVLVRGEIGTGKELIAKWIHHRSPWAGDLFQKISCPVNSEFLLPEKELDGTSNAGTTLLYEVGELTRRGQQRALEFLNANSSRPTFRVICSSSRDLFADAEAGRLDPTLLRRISLIQLNLPPLREHREDIAGLAAYYLAFYSQVYQRESKPLSDFTLHLLRNYGWPGNVRELENLIRRYVILGSEQAIRSELLQRVPAARLVGNGANGVSLKQITRQAVRDVERQAIRRALEENQWNRRRTARALDISYRALLYKIRETGLDVPSTDPVSSDLPAPRFDKAA